MEREREYYLFYLSISRLYIRIPTTREHVLLDVHLSLFISARIPRVEYVDVHSTIAISRDSRDRMIEQVRIKRRDSGSEIMNKREKEKTSKRENARNKGAYSRLRVFKSPILGNAAGIILSLPSLLARPTPFYLNP